MPRSSLTTFTINEKVAGSGPEPDDPPISFMGGMVGVATVAYGRVISTKYRPGESQEDAARRVRAYACHLARQKAAQSVSATSPRPVVRSTRRIRKTRRTVRGRSSDPADPDPDHDHLDAGTQAPLAA